MVTLEHIAERAGVTPQTVSNVLRGHYKARRRDAAERARTIRNIADELGYRVNAAAKATRVGRTGFIGMIRSPSLMHSVHSPEFDQGLDAALHQRGLCLVRDIIDHATTPEEVRIPRIVRECVVDGLLINYAFGTPPAIRETLDRCQIPAVWINRKRDYNCVRPADEGAAFDATVYLLSHGHRDVALLSDGRPPPGELHYSREDRQAGYTRAMQGAGLTPRIEALPVETPPGPDQGRLLRAALTYLKQPNRPTAVICLDVLGRVFLHAAALLGLRVPHDLSVMTFDDNAGGDVTIAVDRVLVPYASMARAAVEELCALLDAPTERRSPVVVPLGFHIGGTVGRPA